MDEQLRHLEEEAPAQTSRTLHATATGPLLLADENLIAGRLAALQLLEPTADLRLKNRGRLAQALNERERLRLRPKLTLLKREFHLTAGALLLWLAAALAAGAGVAWAIAHWQPSSAAAVMVPPTRSDVFA